MICTKRRIGHNKMVTKGRKAEALRCFSLNTAPPRCFAHRCLQCPPLSLPASHSPTLIPSLALSLPLYLPLATSLRVSPRDRSRLTRDVSSRHFPPPTCKPLPLHLLAPRPR